MATKTVQNNEIVVESVAELTLLIDNISKLATEPPSLYINLEGIDLGRHGSVSILSILIAPTQKIYLVDVHTLGLTAFTTANMRGNSLKTILESKTVPKIFFDIRKHSNALFSLFQISVDGIKELQLMELACRKSSRELLSSLAQCIAKESSLSAAAKTTPSLAKDLVALSSAPEDGGQCKFLHQRPLKPEVIQYCTQNVALLPKLYDIYEARLRPPGEAFWRVTIRESTKAWIKLSQSVGYDAKSSINALGWDDDAMERQIDTWNDDLLMEIQLGEYVLDKNDEWVRAPEDNLDDLFNDLYDDEDPTGSYESYDDDWYRDTARDCIGWEEDMIKNGELW